MQDPQQRLTDALRDRYRIERELGQGGMATVYLAHDVRHDRQVAIKVVHSDLAATLGPERFLTEIKTTARLQHPHILPLLDSGEADGILYYVMPYVAGESLRDRLARETQLPLDDAVRIAREVADALGHAHAHGIVHRDIKPENILLQEGHALVADFGIALAVTAAGGPRMTQTGLSLGTPSYMSPEQAMGEKSLDARADIYAVGAVTYEMLTGEPPFTGATVQAIVAKVLNAEPERPTMLRRSVPPNVEEAVLRALAKVPADRWAKAGDFAAALGTAQPTGTVRETMVRGAAASAPRGASRVLVGALGLLAAGGVATAAWLATRPTPVAVPGRFDIGLPDSVELFAGGGRKLALDRDGRQLVVVGQRGSRAGLYLRRLEDTEATLVRGSETEGRSGNVDVSFSPDGQSLLYNGPEGVLRIPVTGGRAELLAPDGSTAHWGDGNVVIFERSASLWRTSSDGREPVRVLAPDTASGRFAVRWQRVLPGGTHAVVTLTTSGDGRPNRQELAVVSLADGEVTPLGVVGSDAHYASGYLIFARQGNLIYAVPFSLRSRRVTGEPQRLFDGVWVGSGGAAGIAVAGNGTMAFQEELAMGGHRIAAVSREGRVRWIPIPATQYVVPRVSPDGRLLLVEESQGRATPSAPILLVDLASGAIQRLTAESEGMHGEWSRDGKRVLFLSWSDSRRRIISRAWDRSTPDSIVLHDSTRNLFEFEPGPARGWTAIRGTSDGGGRDIFLTRTDAMAEIRPFLNSPAMERHPTISPDGRWIAYTSDESGVSEIYLQPIPGPGPRVQVSVNGGVEPLWAPRGTTLYYRSLSAQMMQITLAGDPLAVVRRDSLFEDVYQRSLSERNWSLNPVTGEFFFVQSRGGLRKVVLVVNWLQRAALSRSSEDP
jgi:Tol biopolymer transport system component